jgi:transcriptional regulator with XRE-family HTH domain
MKKITTHENPTYEFSVYKAPVANVNPLKSTTLSKVHTVIVSDRYKAVTSNLRALNDKKEQTACKIKKLDYVTFSGEFKTRSVAGLIKHSGLFCIDLDDLEDVQATKDQVLKLLPPSLMFVSPSGNGLKLVYKININDAEHLQYYDAFEVFFNERLGVAIDDKCKDVPRACFLCHDSEAYFNDNAEVIDRSFIDTFFIPIPKSTPIESKVETVTDVQIIIENLKKWVDKKGSFESGNRNGYISKLAYAYNRYGIPLTDAENDLLSYAQDDFTAEEIRGIIECGYKQTAYHNISEFKVDKPFSIKKKKEKEPTPLLPINGFPEYLQNFIDEYVKVYNVPRDYIAASVLFSTAFAIGNRIELNDKYDNIPLLWMNIIGNVSSGKTEPLKMCLSYFNKKDKESFNEFKIRSSLYEAEMEKPKKERDNSLQAPSYFQYIISDYTPETIPNIHSINNRGLCIYRDELKGWLDDFGRYNKSGEQSTMLSTFYRQPMQINRASKVPVYIDQPCMYVAGGMQPELLGDLAKDNRAENGFLSRLLNVFPDVDVKQPYSKARLSADTFANYHKYLGGLDTIPETINITLSRDAEVMYSDWYNKNADRSNNSPTGYLKGVYGKLDVYALRFAITVYGMNLICNQNDSLEIDGATMKTAIDITEYFRATALKVYDKIFSDSKSKSIDKKAAIIYMSSIGKSQSDIAKALDIGQSYVSQVLKKTKGNK